MERKIGEIFEFKKDWYQCVEGRCKDCHFSEKRFLCKQFITKDFCTHGIIFKKLKRLGEPYKFDGYIFQAYRTFEVPIFIENYATVREVGNNFKISIEIKQTKEDMEEKNNAKHSNSEKIGKNLKPFDLQKAREGKPVCTRDGRKARIICFDRNDLYPIVALIECEDGKEIIGAYSKEGQTEIYEIKGTNLMMLPEKKEGWVNIYKSDRPHISSEICDIITGVSVFETKEGAISYIDKDKEYITTVKI